MLIVVFNQNVIIFSFALQDSSHMLLDDAKKKITQNPVLLVQAQDA